MTAPLDALEVLKKAVGTSGYVRKTLGVYCNICNRPTAHPFHLCHRDECWVGQAERLIKEKEKKK